MNFNELQEKALSFNKALSQIYQQLFNLDKQLANELNLNGGKIVLFVNEAIASKSMRDYIQKISSAYSSANKTLQIINSLADIDELDKNKLTQTQNLCNELVRLLSTMMSSTHIRLSK